MIAIGKTFEFSAAHKLYNPSWSDEKNLAVFGKCANPRGHGHNYRLEVSVTGPISKDTGMIFDATKLSKIVDEEIIQAIDHKNLDQDVPWLEGIPSTSENLVSIFWDRITAALSKTSQGVTVDEIRLWETSRIFAVRRRA